MWERIGSSSAVIVGAVVLFLLFTIALWILESKEHKPMRKKQKRAPYSVPLKTDKAA